MALSSRKWNVLRLQCIWMKLIFSNEAGKCQKLIHIQGAEELGRITEGDNKSYPSSTAAQGFTESVT